MNRYQGNTRGLSPGNATLRSGMDLPGNATLRSGENEYANREIGDPRVGWEIKKLGEVLLIERGGSPRPIEKYMTDSHDGINWIKISDATASEKYIYETKEKITKDGLHKTRVVNEGDFILSNSMSFGRPYIMKTTGCIHDGWLVLKQNGKKIFETEFLYYLLSSPFVFQQFNLKAAGSTVRNLNIALVRSVDVPIPPLPEQQRIVAILDEAFAAIAKAKANTEQNLKNAKELFESYLQSVFENKGEGWEEKTIGEMCDLMTGGTPSSSKPEYYEGGKIKWLVSGDVNMIEINDCEGRITELGMANSNTKYLPLNSIIIALNGQGKTRGTVAMLKTQATCNQSLVSICPKNIKKIISDYIFYNLKVRYQEIRKITGDSGNDRRGLNMPLIRSIRISFPESIVEQDKYVKQFSFLLNETKRLEAIYRRKIGDLEELKKSVLDKAFKGEL